MNKREKEKRRKLRTGYKVRTAALQSGNPRVCVYRTSKNIYTQLIDDTLGKVLVSSSSLSPNLKKEGIKGYNQEGALMIGRDLGKKISEIGIKKVVFDRRSYRFHGRIKSLVQGISESVEV